jgi:poly-gamma-glutamate synthesis protein (capsule biosynthesis protein)
MAAGDISLHMKDSPESAFISVAPVLKTADMVTGQLETPCTLRSAVTSPWGVVGHPHGFPLGRDPKNLEALRFAGFNVIHMSGNKVWDAGIPGIEDTMSGLHSLGIATIGVGMNIAEATTPAILERNGTKTGFLSYNCVGPNSTWANPIKPGCAWVRIVTAYEVDHPTPGANPTVYTFPEPDSLKAMIKDISKLRPLCDVLVVHFHKGLGMMQVKLAMYEQSVSYAAIDAGADLVVGEHAHILRAIEQYKGKTIFHGLASFVDPPTPPVQQSDWWLQQKTRIFQEIPDYKPAESQHWPKVNYAKLSIIAKLTIEGGKISRVGFLPCMLDDRGYPEVLKHDERGQQVFDYMGRITGAVELDTKYEWDGDEVVVLP